MHLITHILIIIMMMMMIIMMMIIKNSDNKVYVTNIERNHFISLPSFLKIVPDLPLPPIFKEVNL